ncbi:hypothetical protein D3C78_770660 [compost metagenome]
MVARSRRTVEAFSPGAGAVVHLPARGAARAVYSNCRRHRLATIHEWRRPRPLRQSAAPAARCDSSALQRCQPRSLRRTANCAQAASSPSRQLPELPAPLPATTR